MDFEHIQKKMTRERSAEQIENKKRFQANNDDDTNTITPLTKLPDELLLLVLSYLNIVDIFQAFHELNQRFNNLIYDCARCITLPSNVTNLWLEQYIPQLKDRIKIIYFSDKSLQCVLDNKWSFLNLRLMNLQGNGWSLSLRIGEKPLSIILMSSLKFLKNALFMDFLSIAIPNDIINDEDDDWKTRSYPFIERLSLDACYVKNLITIFTRTPNLLHLKISFPISQWHNDTRIGDLNRITGTTRLVTLNIETNPTMNFNVLEQLIKISRTCLKNLILKAHVPNWIDGHRLEEIFKSCQQLKKLVFFLEYKKKKNDTDVFQSSFQSEWWLDKRRPLVYIQHNDFDGTIVATIPFRYLFTFKNDLYNWYVNKINQNSSFVCFNSNKIHFTNNVNQAISLEYLYSIDRTFTSFNQSLCFNFCNIEAVDILFELLMDDESMTPVLPNVNHFIVGLQNKLDSLTLCVWILLMPNLQKLDISNLTTFNKIELAKELKDMIDNDQRLKPSFDHINELIFFSQSNDFDSEMENELSVAFRKVFINLKIS